MSGKYWNKAWSLVDGCTPCSPGCQNCWLKTMENRFKRCPYCGTTKKQCDEGKSKGSIACCPDCDHSGKVTPRPDRLEIPLHVKKPTVWSIWSDLFHEEVPFYYIKDAWNIIAKRLDHTFLILTKRPIGLLNFTKWMAGSDHISIASWPRNVWLGLTICTRKEADEKLPLFSQVPGKKFLSIEPMLENIKIPIHIDIIDGVIVGPETGPRRRPCKIEWIRSIKDQCQAAGVPLFIKALDLNGRISKDMAEWPEDLRMRQLSWI